MLDRAIRFLRKPSAERAAAVVATARWLGSAVRGPAQARRDLALSRGLASARAGDRVFADDDPLYLSYRPDSDAIHHAHPELATLARRWVAHNRANNAGDIGRFYALVFNIKQIMAENVAGDFAELGVYRGNSAAALAHFARQCGRQTFLFDTFEGFDRRDIAGLDQRKGSEFADTSLDLVRSVVGDNDDVHYVKGYFPASVTDDIRSCRFAVVHLDCDLHDPTKAGLEFFYPRLSPGGLLILHDYSSLFWKGCKTAIDDFVAGIPEPLVLIPDKSGTAMLRKNR
jgi:hypothetical protein